MIFIYSFNHSFDHQITDGKWEMNGIYRSHMFANLNTHSLIQLVSHSCLNAVPEVMYYTRQMSLKFSSIESKALANHRISEKVQYTE